MLPLNTPDSYAPFRHLSDDEISNPFPVLAEIFEEYPLDDMRELLKIMAKILLVKGSPLAEAEHRSKLIDFLDKLEKTLEVDLLIVAVYQG